MPSGGQNKINSDDLRGDIESLARELGETPTLGQYRERGEYSAGAIYNEFGSWNDALDACELEINELHSKEPVVIECAYCDDTDEKQPSEVENAQYNYCSQDCHYAHKQERYSGNGNPRWNSKPVDCEACGTTVYRPKHKRERYYRAYCSDCFGEATVSIECEWCGESRDVWPSLVDRSRFCSTRCVGRWLSRTRTGESHPRWRPGKRPEYYGPNWFEQRGKALNRDQRRCRDCGITEPDHIVKHGEGLTAHHLTPFRHFELDDGSFDYESANRLENLVAVCRVCHMAREREVTE